jgi:hypothetical protein
LEEVKKQLAPKINEKLIYVTSMLNQEHETEEQEETPTEVVIP